MFAIKLFASIVLCTFTAQGVPFQIISDDDNERTPSTWQEQYKAALLDSEDGDDYDDDDDNAETNVEEEDGDTDDKQDEDDEDDEDDGENNEYLSSRKKRDDEDQGDDNFSVEEGDDESDEEEEEEDNGEYGDASVEKRKRSASSDSSVILRDLNARISESLKQLAENPRFYEAYKIIQAKKGKMRNKRIRRESNSTGNTKAISSNAVVNNSDSAKLNSKSDPELRQQLIETLQRLNSLPIPRSNIQAVPSDPMQRGRQDILPKSQSVQIPFANLDRPMIETINPFPHQLNQHNDMLNNEDDVNDSSNIRNIANDKDYGDYKDNDDYDNANHNVGQKDKLLASPVQLNRVKRIKRYADSLPQNDELFDDSMDEEDAEMPVQDIVIDENENFDIMENNNPEGLGVHDLSKYKGPRAEFATEYVEEEHLRRKKRDYSKGTHLKPLGGEPFGPLAQQEEVEKRFSNYFNKNPQEIPWEEPNLLSNCWAQAMLSSIYGFSPSCNVDGSFSSKQCHLQRCWCVNTDGSPQITNFNDRFFYSTKAIMLECTQNP